MSYSCSICIQVDIHLLIEVALLLRPSIDSNHVLCVSHGLVIHIILTVILILNNREVKVHRILRRRQLTTCVHKVALSGRDVSKTAAVLEHSLVSHVWPVHVCLVSL